MPLADRCEERPCEDLAMIQNDEQLDIVRQQLERAEAALQSICRDVLPQNPARYDLMSEAYIDQIGALRDQIDRYLGVKQVSGRHSNERHAEVAGRIREVDLDENTFILRERSDGTSDLPCEYDEAIEAEVKASLDERVAITGLLRTSAKTQRDTMEVESIDLLPADNQAAARG